MTFQRFVLSAIVLSLAGLGMPASLWAASAANPATTKTDTPVFSPLPGTYNSDQLVKIKDATADSTIYYTTNGSTPTTSSAKYKSPIVVSKTQTIRAIAVAPKHAESDLAKGTYTLATSSFEVLVATASGNDIVTVSVNGGAAFAVGAKNNGKEADPSITVTTSKQPATLPVDVTLCQENPKTGQCLAPPAHSVEIGTLAAGANKIFSVFVAANSAVPKDPSEDRINVLFKNSQGVVLGSGSVGVVITK